MTDWGLHLTPSSGKRQDLRALALDAAAQVARHALSASWGPEPSGVPLDRRFVDWDGGPFSVLRLSFELTQRWWGSATRGVWRPVKHHEDRAAFAVRQMLDRLSPAGLVLRTPVMELVQDAPSTVTTHPELSFIGLTWTMKYCILDLPPQDFMSRHLVAQGHTVVCITWKNPSAVGRSTGRQHRHAAGRHPQRRNGGGLRPHPHALGQSGLRAALHRPCAEGRPARPRDRQIERRLLAGNGRVLPPLHVHGAAVRAGDTPLRQAVSGDDVGALCAFPVSNAARSITGDTLCVDAGLHILG